MQIEFQIVFISILSSTVGYIMATLVDWLKYNKSYKDDYYKKIIEKRFNAYELIESILIHMQRTVDTNNFIYFPKQRALQRILSHSNAKFLGSSLA